VSGVDWFPAVAMLAAGLVTGAIVWWRAQKTPAAARTETPLPLRDLEGKRDALIAQLRELEFAGEKRTPEQIARDRHELEHQAARVLREIDVLASVRGDAPRPSPKKESEIPAPAAPAVAAKGSSLRGFLWGIGSAAAFGVLFYFVSQSAKERKEGGSLTGNTPRETAAPETNEASDAEVQAAQAALAKNPNDVEARLALVRLHLIRQDMMAVFKETQAVLKISPGEPRALSYQSLVRLAMGQSQQAESMLKEAIAKDPQLLDAYIHLLLVYTRTNRPSDADTVLAEASKRFPTRAASLKELLGEMRDRSTADATASASGATPDPHAGVSDPAPASGQGAAPAGAEKKIAGVLELDASLAGQTFPGAIVFVTLREGGFGAGPPLAARRIPAASFPMAFEIGSRDSMTGQPLPDDLLVEARVDSDGDPLTRPPSDPYGRADRVSAGTTGVKVVLKRRTP